MLAITRTNLASNLFLFGIFLLAASLPYSKFLLSLSEIIMLFSWVLDGNLFKKIKQFLKNKTALIISSVFLVHLIGLFYTSEFTYGIEDVKKKIPLLLLPLIFSTMPPLTKNIFEKLLAVFLTSVVTSSFICFYVLMGYSHKMILQPRDASIFLSHIRLSLLISLSIFILIYFLKEKDNLLLKIIIPAIIIWLFAVMIMLETETGLACTAIVGTFLFFRLLIRSKNISVKISLILLFFLLFIGTAKYFSSAADEYTRKYSIDKNHLPLVTKLGNKYSNDTSKTDLENGNHVWISVCEKELSSEWNKKSSLDYNGKDLKGNEVKYTLIRFLTSKGLKKDAEGVTSLSQKEISAVEKGIPNANYINVFNPFARIHKISWEFDSYLKGDNPSGHSVVQRLEFWKAATGIIKENFLFGVGTGDVEQAFNAQYKKTNSPLTKEWRLRSHNQFLAIGTAFGIIGLILFLFSLFYPLFTNKNYRDYFYLTFFIIAILSMLTEDTLESQAGVTFFAFFNSLFLFAREKTTTRTES